MNREDLHALGNLFQNYVLLPLPVPDRNYWLPQQRGPCSSLQNL